ncbi:MAG: T9SS type A sorting domain-containing protein, partial [Bacteroidales bacterium]|nr:T9SS type A sorting domain-containing protein [Bacteroidales bacterium]
HSRYLNTYSIITAPACDTYTVHSGDETYTSSGTYLDTIPNATGCNSILTIMLTINNSNTVFESATACDSYFWTVDGNTYTNSGVYSSTLTNVAGCDSTIILNLTIRTVDTSVTVNSTTITANATGAYYQWIDCSTMLPISGEVNQSYTATANGSYAVIINEYGCTDTSFCYSITTVGILENTFESLFSIYPNPTTGQLTITFKETYDQITLTVKNIGGKFISSTVIKEKEKVTLDIEGAKGYYFVNIESSEGQHAILKILKQ